jgi:hypothetical protein
MSWERDKPIIGVVGFNLLTLLVFVTAPVAWETDNLWAVCFLVLFCQLLIYLGFRIGCQTRLERASGTALPFLSGETLVSYLFVIYVLTFPISYAYRLQLGPFDVIGIASRLVAGWRDPHFGYVSTLETTSGPIPWSVFFAVSIFDQIFLAAGFLYWRQLRFAKKVVFVTLVALELFYWIGIATTFGVVTLATTFALSTVFWRARAGGRRIRTVVANALVLSLLVVGTIGFFSYNLYRRSNFTEIDVAQFEIAGRSIVLEHPVLALVPAALQPTYLKVVSYLGQGYYHTCLALDLDFRPTAFLGNNTALISLGRAFGIDVWDDKYMHRLQRMGVDEYGVWHSAYTWYASDVSFYGVPIVLLIVGFLYGFSWTQGVRGDFLSRIVFIVFGNMLLFLFANNTYLASVFYACMVFVPVWAVTRFAAVFGWRSPGAAVARSGSVPARSRPAMKA